MKNIDKEEFLKSWEVLTGNMQALIRISDTNRRLIAGIATLLISKGAVTNEEIQNLDRMVYEFSKRKNKKAKKRRKKNGASISK